MVHGEESGELTQARVHRVVLALPSPRAQAWAARLTALGHDALALPFTRIADRSHQAEVQACLQRVVDFDWVVMVSPSAVLAAAAMVPRPWPAAVGVAVVGPGSLQALRDCAPLWSSARVLCPPGPRFDAAALCELAPLREPRGLRVLVVRGNAGNDGWIEALRSAGAQVEVCAAYANEPVPPEAGAVARMAGWLDDGGPAPVFVVTQAQTVDRLEALLAGQGRLAQAHRAPVLCIHPRIAAALERSAWADVRVIEPGEPALVAALESLS